MTWTCEQVLQDIKRHNLDCDPKTFHILFIALTEPNSEIAQELRRMEESGAQLTGRALDFLYETYIKPEQESERHLAVVQNSQARTSAITLSAKTSQKLTGHLIKCAEAQKDGAPLRETVLQLQSEFQENLANIVEQAEALESELRAYQAELFTDALTGVPNRRFLEVELPNRLAATKEPLHIALIDIDHFKRINDEHGHVLGDHALRVVTRLIQTHLGRQDVLCRYGGEEFCILFYNSDTRKCVALLEAIRTDIGRRTIYHNRTGKSFGPVTISAGLAQAKPGDELEMVIHRADQQMYNSKSSGRNRVSS